MNFLNNQLGPVYTLNDMVAIGTDDFDTIQTRFGPQQIKRDIYLSDSSGNVNFQLFKNKLNMFHSQNSGDIHRECPKNIQSMTENTGKDWIMGRYTFD